MNRAGFALPCESWDWGGVPEEDALRKREETVRMDYMES